MRKALRNCLSLAVAFSGYALLANPAQAVSPVVVSVNGSDYEVTYFTGKYDDNSSSFETPANNGLMPWWGNQNLATDFAIAVEFQLGKPNSFVAANNTGPYFAFSPNTPAPNSFTDIMTYTAYTNNTLALAEGKNLSYAYATATLVPPPVPGPLPLFGAAAAFGASRRLRRRIQLSA
jgi:hypothetical protein